MKLLVLGRDGQLGRCLYDQLSYLNHEMVFTSRSEIDVTNLQAAEKKIMKLAPDVVINATGYTAVDDAEQEPIIANRVNALAVANIANACQRLGSWLIHISTDYVFDGNSVVPYKEEDQTNPQNVYGNSKLTGELAILASGCRYLIVRTSWVFSEYGRNFLSSMLRLGDTHKSVNIVSDQIGCPTYAQDLAKAFALIVGSLGNDNVESGVYHYGGDSSCSWHEFACLIFEEAKHLGFGAPRVVRAIKTSEYHTPASRPAFSVLDCGRIEKDFFVKLSDWRAGTRSALQAITKNNH